MTSAAGEPDPYWNHNTHYFPWVLQAVPAGCRLTVDVGCGDGLLLGKLAARSARVVGVEACAAVAEVARARLRDVPNADVVTADFLRYPLVDQSVDMFTAVASLHHLDLTAALAAMRRALTPGGAIAVVGLAREASPLDLLCGAASLPLVKALDRYHGVGGSDAPLRDPTMSWSQTRREFRYALPGVRFRRRLAWRYTAYWRKPG